MDKEEPHLSSFFRFALLLVFSSALLSSCLDLDRFDDVDLSRVSGTVAIPVFDSDITISDVLNKSNAEASFSISQEGNITLFYNGQLLQQTANQVFPPIPAEEIEIPDTNSVLDIQFPVNFVSTRTTFKGNFAFFTLQSQFDDEVEVTLNYPELTKDGESFSATYTLQPYELLITDFIPLTGWMLSGDINQLKVTYDARRTTGERVKLSYVSMKLDFLNFSYVEGFLDKTEFDFKPDFLPIGIFDSWKSGDISFEDPRVILYIDNSFGFPVRAIAERIEIETIEGDTLPLESTFVDTGIDIDYSRVSQVGDVTVTEFAFDKTNSNIDVLFGKKVKQLNYDMLALAFPDGIGTLGYLTDSSFFRIRVALELPTKTNINKLILGDTFVIELDTFQELTALEYKLKGANSYPIDMQVQGYFIDASGNIIDSLSDDRWITFPGTSPVTDFSPLDTTQAIKLFDETDTKKIRQATSIYLLTKFDTPSEITEPIWLKEEQSLRLSMGIKAQYEN